MARPKKVQASMASAIRSPATGGTLNYRLDPARQAELSRKIEEGIVYYKRTFGHELTPQEVVDIMLKIVERDKERLFVNRIMPISEADLLWYAQENEVEVYGGQGQESSGGDGGSHEEAGSGSNGAGEASSAA